MATTSPTPPSTVRWPVETSRPSENFVQVYQGEAVRLTCTLLEYGKPMNLSEAAGEFYWQPCTTDDPTRWWTLPSADVDVDGATVSVLFNAATMDDGHGSYRCFFRLTTTDGSVYRANGVVAMLPSPGSVPNEIPFPPRVIDFDSVVVENAPWAVDGILKGDGQGGLSAAAAGTDYATPSMATLTARGLGAWTADPAQITKAGEPVATGVPEYGDFETWEGTKHGWYWMNPDGVARDLDSDDPGETEFETVWEDVQDYDITFTRTALPGYQLGSQAAQPLADADVTAAALAAKYAKPSGGIPKSDLASAVQSSLDKADAALPKSQIRYALGTAITSGTVTAADRTVNRVTIDSAYGVTLRFPDAVSGYARDFLVLATIADYAGGSLSFILPENSTIYGDGFGTLPAAGETYLYSVTEVADNVFFVKAQKMEVPT